MEYAMDICQAREKGGRMIIYDNYHANIIDCPFWPDDFSQAILSRFPNCNISFMSSQVFLCVCVCVFG